MRGHNESVSEMLASPERRAAMSGKGGKRRRRHGRSWRRIFRLPRLGR